MVAGVSLAAIVADAIHWRAVYGTIAVMAGLAWVALRTILHAVSHQPPQHRCRGCAWPGGHQASAACLCRLHDGVRCLWFYLGSVNGLVALVYGLGFGGSAISMETHNAREAVDHRTALRGLHLSDAGLAHSLVAILVLLGLLGLTNHFGINLLIVRLTAIDSARRGTIMGLHSAVTNLAVFAGTAGFPLCHAWFCLQPMLPRH